MGADCSWFLATFCRSIEVELSTPFPVRLPPLDGESTLGYAMRVAQEHSYGEFSWVLKMVDATPTQLMRDRPTVERFGELTREPEFCMRAAILDKGGVGRIGNDVLPGRIEHYRQELSIELFNLTSVAFCPACLREGCYHRTIFSLSFCRVCPKHGQLLIDRCSAPKCKIAVTPKSLFNRACRCGQKYEALEADSIYQVSQEYWGWFESRLLSTASSVALTDSMQFLEEFSGLSTEDHLILLALFFCSEAPIGYKETLEKFLRGCRKLESKKLALGIERTLQRMQRWRSDLSDRVRELPDPIDDKRTLLELATSECRPFLSWRLPGALVFIQERLLELVEQRRFSREERIALKGRGRIRNFSVMSVEDGGALLGIKPDRVFGLFAHVERPTKWSPRRLIFRDDVLTLLDDLRKYALEKITIDALEGVSFVEAASMANALGVKPREFLSGARLGEIAMWFNHEERPHLSSLIFDKAAVLAWCQSTRKIVSAEWIAWNKVSPLTLLDKETAEFLWSRSLLEKRRIPQTGSDEFNLVSVLSFVKEHVQLSRCAQLLRITPEAMVEKCRHAGTALVAGPGIGGSTYLARRRNVELIVSGA